ncbi:MAG TPA: VOC family protein [Sphingomicrobium sp.]|nr:VOC family protein [Sphingomicrobium sp.]
MTDVRTEAGPAPASDDRRNPHGSFIWYELLTTDAQGAKAFYEAVVPGWQVGPAAAEHQGYREINISGGGHAGGMMELNDEMLAGGAKPIWLGYVGVDDVDFSVAEITRKGGQLHLPAFDIPNVGRIAMVTDPQGNAFYVMRGSIEAASNAFSPASAGHVAWNELSTTDPAAARGFYGELFGWTSDEFMPMGEFGEYRFFAHAGTTIGAVCGVMPGGTPGWRYYIRVASIGAAAEAVTANGGSVAMGPHEVPGGDHIIIGVDPQGAEFALVGKA